MYVFMVDVFSPHFFKMGAPHLTLTPQPPSSVAYPSLTDAQRGRDHPTQAGDEEALGVFRQRQ